MARADESEVEAAFPDAMGSDRIGAGWIAIVIAGIAFAAVASALVSVGSPAPLLAIAPIFALFALFFALTRRTALDLARGEVVLIRRLGPFGWRRRWPLRQVGAVAVRLLIARPRRSISDGTLAGDQIHAWHEVWLLGRTKLRLAEFLSPFDPPAAREAAEALALALGARLGVEAAREGYRVQVWPDGRVISAPARGHVEPLRGDPAAASRALEEWLAQSGNRP